MTNCWKSFICALWADIRPTANAEGRDSLAEGGSREEGWQDVLWALINKALSFLFNH